MRAARETFFARLRSEAEHILEIDEDALIAFSSELRTSPRISSKRALEVVVPVTLVSSIGRKERCTSETGCAPRSISDRNSTPTQFPPQTAPRAVFLISYL